MNERMHDIVDKHVNDIILDDLSKLIAVRSVLEEDAATEAHPFGPNVTAALECYLESARRMGFETRNIDNMVGYVEAGEGPLFGILVHLDVVPEGKAANWKYPPFEACVENGRFYGRGACDDKGPAVAVLHALRALRDSGVKWNRRFRIIAGLDEESGFRCIKRYRETEEIPEASFSPDANFPVVNGEKGILQFQLRKRIASLDAMGLPEVLDMRGGTRANVVPDELLMFFRRASAGNLEVVLGPIGAVVKETGAGVVVKVPGRSAHAMEPWEGENAILKFLGEVEKLDFGPPLLHVELVKLAVLFGDGCKGEGLGVACEDEISGALTCNLATLAYRDRELSITCDIRYPVKIAGGFVMERLQQAARSIDWEFEVLSHEPPLFVDPDSELVRALLDAYEAVTGERGEPFAIGGGTYSRTMPNAVSFGGLFPGEEETAHRADECVPVASLQKMTHVYAEALARLNATE